MSFVLCKQCCRHVKHTESSCPFCGADIHTSSGMKKAAMGVVLVGLGVAVACGGTTEDGGSGGTEIQDAAAEGGQAGVYGPPPDGGDSAVEDAPVAMYGPAPMDASDEDSGQAGVYGPPPVDAAYGPPPVDASDDVEDDGPVAAYGPPPVDSGVDADGDAMSGAYGPPPDAG